MYTNVKCSLQKKVYSMRTFNDFLNVGYIMVSPPVKFATFKLTIFMYILYLLPKYNFSKVYGVVLERFHGHQ